MKLFDGGYIFMEKKTLGWLLVITSTTSIIACGMLIKDRINEYEKREYQQEFVNDLRSSVHALKTCLARAHVGGYGENPTNDMITNDFQFNKITFFLKD